MVQLYMLCEGETSFCIGLIFRKVTQFFFVFFTGFTSFSVLLIFPLLMTIFVFVHGFDAISSNIDQILSVNPSANVFVFSNFKVHHKNWLTYSAGTDRSGELCYDFPILNFLFRWLTFQLGSLRDSHSPALLDFFLFIDSTICSISAFPPLGNSDHLVVSVSINFPSKSTGMPLFPVQLMAVIVLIGVVFVII